MGPDPAVAAVRLAVRRALADFPPNQPALVACSGGADSVALAAALAFEARRAGRPAGLITVDHNLQPGSDRQAARVLALGRELGLDPVLAESVRVGPASADSGNRAPAASGRGAPADSGHGPEGDARAARYRVLNALVPANLILLGHTADDQAETVLLGLGRGSGPRSIAGMRPVTGSFLRPLLGLRRRQTEAACVALELPWWRDPHNSDPRYRRVRLRHEVLPLLEDVLAGGVTEALARTAGLLRQDLDTLDQFAELALDDAGRRSAVSGGLAVAALEVQPDAILTRVLKFWAESGGADDLGAVHVEQLQRLIRHWHGQVAVDLPGGYRAVRASGTLKLIPQLITQHIPHSIPPADNDANWE